MLKKKTIYISYEMTWVSNRGSKEKKSLKFGSCVAVLVRRGPDNKAELVLLDHGLYEYLSQQ